MGMDYGVKVGHYIEFENSDIINILHDQENLEDVFCDHEDRTTCIITSNQGDSIFSGDRFCDAKIIHIDDAKISKAYHSFMKNMAPVIDYLRNTDAKYKVKFGVVSYWS